MPRRPLRCTPRARRYACVAAMHQTTPHHYCTSAAAPFHVRDSQIRSLLPHSLTSTSSSLWLFSSLSLWAPQGGRHGHHGQQAELELLLLLAAAGQGQGRAWPWLAEARPPTGFPATAGHFPLESRSYSVRHVLLCSEGGRRWTSGWNRVNLRVLDTKHRFIWIVHLDCGWFWGSPGFPKQKCFPLSFLYADF